MGTIKWANVGFMGIRAEETLEGAQDAHGDMRPERGSHVVSVRLTNVSLDPQEAGGLSAKRQHPEKLFSKHKEKLRHILNQQIRTLLWSRYSQVKLIRIETDSVDHDPNCV